MGRAGAPICIDIGIVTVCGAGICTTGLFFVFFLCGKRTPCKNEAIFNNLSVIYT